MPKRSTPARNPRWSKPFLDALCRTSNVTASAKEAGVDISAVYRKRRRDAAFARKWHAALCEGYEHLEMDVLRRLREGDFLSVDGGKFDFTNALRVLNAHRQTIGQQRAVDDFEDEAAILASIDKRLDTIRERTRALPAPLAKPASPANDSADA